jgi:hypothetical protein
MVELEEDTWDPRTVGDAFSDLVTIKLDSCLCTWYFQPVRMRFRRASKGSGSRGVSARWRQYFGLRFDDAYDGFTVALDEQGVVVLHSWCHHPGRDECEHCGGAGPGGRSPVDVRTLAQ